jgi:hypothetical protein
MRNERSAVFSGIIGFLAALAAGPAMSAVITLSQGHSALFNFDLTGQTPPPAPTYPEIMIVWQWGDNTNDKAHTDFYGNLNGSGLLFSDDNGPSSFAYSVAAYTPQFTELRDGLFSIRVTSTSGTFSVNPYAYGSNGLPGWEVRTPNVFGDYVPGSSLPPGGEVAVPVPATLPLLLPGLVGIGFLAHRWTKAAA